MIQGVDTRDGQKVLRLYQTVIKLGSNVENNGIILIIRSEGGFTM